MIFKLMAHHVAHLTPIRQAFELDGEDFPLTTTDQRYGFLQRVTNIKPDLDPVEVAFKIKGGWLLINKHSDL